MNKYKVAAVFMLIHGGLMEIGGCLALLPILAMGSGQTDGSSYLSFIVPYLQENMNLMVVIGGIYGVVRVTGAIGLLKNRMWGFVLSLIVCTITMALMIFMLPAGIIDGILAGSALLLLLIQYFGDRKIGS